MEVENIISKILSNKNRDMTDQIIYKDEVGNTIHKKYIKTRNRWQIYGKNKEGKLLCPEGFNELTKKAKLNIKSKSKVSGIETFRYKGE